MVIAERPADAARSARLQRERCREIIREEFRHIPDEEMAPLRLSGHRSSRLRPEFVTWLDSRAFAEQQLQAFVHEGTSACDITRRLRAVEAVWAHLIEDKTQEQTAVELRSCVTTVQKDVTRVVDWLVDQRWPELRQEPVRRSA